MHLVCVKKRFNTLYCYGYCCAAEKDTNQIIVLYSGKTYFLCLRPEGKSPSAWRSCKIPLCRDGDLKRKNIWALYVESVPMLWIFVQVNACMNAEINEYLWILSSVLMHRTSPIWRIEFVFFSWKLFKHWDEWILTNPSLAAQCIFTAIMHMSPIWRIGFIFFSQKSFLLMLIHQWIVSLLHFLSILHMGSIWRIALDLFWHMWILTSTNVYESFICQILLGL